MHTCVLEKGGYGTGALRDTWRRSSLSSNVILFRDVRSVRARQRERRKTYEQKRRAVGYAARLNAPGYARANTGAQGQVRRSRRLESIKSAPST